MAVPSLSSLFAIGADVLSAFRDATTNALLLQTGDVVTGQVESDRVESWQHVGLVSIPSNPVAGQAACQGVVIKRGDIDVCTNTRDIRGLAIAGTLVAGETCIYAGGADGSAQGRTLYKADGSVTNYTTQNNTAGAKSIYARVGTGLNAKTGAPDGFTWSAPWGVMKFDATGFHIQLSSGPEFHLGSVGGLPAPLDKIASYCNITAGTFRANVSNSTVGLGTVQLANAQATQAALAALQAQITALAGAIDVQPKGTVTAVPFAVGIIATGASAAAAAQLLITTTASADL